ncbi:LysR family transcriptional regulator [Thalassotalea nanhaiensis]|uniref:LysR family transcriptional regulator n=1 Tax=Thalassotalea nanhaiensis TaxID=3065648 RepID=A0ABY9TK62_9GAMM|nr:LysR family transcriptional regulator [Colwelliaceae bacterium SQ345]
MNKLEQKLARVDLNLLISLSVLLNERSVSKAADVMFVTQPAMSKALQRLRDIFDDPLFHRTSTGIFPTAKGMELEQKLPSILNQVNGLLKQNEFTPATCNETFSISVPSVICHLVLLPFILKLNKIAPDICIVDFPSEADPFTSLEKGKYDFAIHIAKPKNSHFSHTSLGFVKPNVFARKSHPLANKKAPSTIDDLCRYKFIDYQIGPTESKSFENPADRIYRLLNFKPQISCKSSQLSMLTALLESNDYLFIAPSFMLNTPEFADKFSSIYEFDLAQEHMYELLLLEAPQIKYSPAEQWLKNELVKSINID